MKRSERGFTLIEFLVVLAIVALIAGAAGAATIQLFASTKRSNDHMTAVRQVQNAGFWVSRDAMMADNATFNNETPENFLVLTWTEWRYDEDSTYHSVTYSIEDLSDGIRKLVRTHWSRKGENEVTFVTLVAKYIYYDSEDPNSTKATYENSLLTVQITASIGEANEIKEYRIWHRPNF